MPYQEEILNPCGEPDNDGGTDNNDGNGGGTGGEVDESTDIILEEKFLVPNQTLQNENGILTSADREINLIQPNLFFDTSGMSRLSLRTQDYREKTKFQIATTSSASMDLFRVCLNKLWSWTGASEEWLENETYFGEPTTYNQPKDIFQYEISNESFENGWGKFWQNDLKIVFILKMIEVDL